MLGDQILTMVTSLWPPPPSLQWAPKIFDCLQLATRTSQVGISSMFPQYKGSDFILTISHATIGLTQNAVTECGHRQRLL